MIDYHSNKSSSTLRASLHPTLAGIEFHLESADRLSSGYLAVDISSPCIEGLNSSEYDLVAASALLVVCGFFTPTSIVLEWDSEATKATEFIDLLRILYDIRAYCTKTEPFLPSIAIDSSINNLPPSLEAPDGPDLSGFSHVQLFSGGIDSTYSLIRLREEGQTPLALFLGANIDTIDLEWSAAKKIVSEMNVPLLRLDIVTEGLPKRGADSSVWPQFGQFPYYNSIPHGRDILSAALASIIATRNSIGHIAFGQEKESREKVISYRGLQILRHDVESLSGSAILEKWLNRHLIKSLKIVSPIETFTIEKIRRSMFDSHPQLLAMTQSCFWEKLCCRCIKCVSTYILQRLAGSTVFEFSENPLADPENLDLADAVLSDVPDNEIGYGSQVRGGIARILLEGKYTKEDYWVLKASELKSSSIKRQFTGEW